MNKDKDVLDKDITPWLKRMIGPSLIGILCGMGGIVATASMSDFLFIGLCVLLWECRKLP